MTVSVKFEYPQILYAAKAEYIDPQSCGSMVAYKIFSETYFDASIDLSDCNRKITWTFDSDTTIEKIDNAIAMFGEFRRELLKARKRWDKIEAEADKARKEREQKK